MAASHSLLTLNGISKAFPGVLANDQVSLAVQPGEIHALLGENGAGKSTLVKILYGLLAPDQGTISLNGRPVQITSPTVARALGIGMVFQHFSLFDALSVAENVAVGLKGAVPGRKLEQRIRSLSDRYGLGLDPAAPVFRLSVGEKQRVEIVRTLLQEPKLIVLDEPTSVLTPQEAEQLFVTLRALAAEGRGIIYISHKLAEIQSLCDRATILRRGRVVDSCNPQQETAASLAERMVGSIPKAPNRQRQRGAPLLVIDGLEVCRGEILGIAGVAGNGQDRLMDRLTGEQLSAPDAVRIADQPVGQVGPNRRRQLGAAFVPEERLGHAAVPAMPLAANLFLSRHGEADFLRHGLMRAAALSERADAVVQRFDVRTGRKGEPIAALSGGNIQKFVVGREIDRKPELLVINQPTWGVDAAAADRIHREVAALADGGAAVLVISQDLDELIALCDRIAVIHHGQVGQPRRAADWTTAALGLAMAGSGESREGARK